MLVFLWWSLLIALISFISAVRSKLLVLDVFAGVSIPYNMIGHDVFYVYWQCANIYCLTHFLDNRIYQRYTHFEVTDTEERGNKLNTSLCPEYFKRQGREGNVLWKTTNLNTTAPDDKTMIFGELAIHRSMQSWFNVDALNDNGERLIGNISPLSLTKERKYWQKRKSEHF